MKHKTSLLRLLLCIAVPYIVFGVVLYVFQSSLVYFPNTQDFNNCSAFSEYQALNIHGTRAYYKHVESDSLLVLYHGNAGSACDRSTYKSILEQSNASVLFVEYTGYSNDPTPASKAHILHDVQNIHAFIEQKQLRTVIVLGESIGSGPASYHASLGGVHAVLLIAPFANLVDVAQAKIWVYPVAFMLTENYTNAQWLQDFTGSVLIAHGANDQVIPHRFSMDLYDALPTTKKQYVLLPGIHHNDVWSSALFRDAVTRFITQDHK